MKRKLDLEGASESSEAKSLNGRVEPENTTVNMDMLVSIAVF